MRDMHVNSPTSPQSVDALRLQGMATTGSAIAYLSAARWLTSLSVLGILSLLIGLGCLTVGAESLGVAVVLHALGIALQDGHADVESVGVSGVILLQVRLPRVVLAFLVGSSLAAVGVALQALLRNPLADPYVLGISSGAAFGATLGILLGVSGTVMGLSVLPLWAFVGGLLSILVVYRISLAYRMLSVHTLLLAGVILNALFSALIMFSVSIADPTRAFKMMMWLMGTLVSPEYSTLLWLVLFLGFGCVWLFWAARPLNILTMGEETARALGVEIERVKKLIFVVAALMTGAVVSIAGLIGFVGMVVPHTVRMIVGADHRLLLPASALVGGMFLMIADTVARTVLAPTELPVGVVTALIGGPVFIYLLVKRRAGVAL
jgi:ABC-type Fe3+-siderophore transport system permease subunit